MARVQPDPSVRLARLIEAKRLIKPGEVWKLKDLAAACGVTDRRVSAEVKNDPDFPMLNAGQEGVAYRIDAAAACDYLIAKCEAKIAATKAQTVQHGALVGITVAGGSVPDVVTMSRLLDMTLKVQAERVKMGELCDATAAAQLFNDQSSRHINGIMGISHRIDPTNLLPIELRKRLDDELRSLANTLKAEDERKLVKFRADSLDGRNRTRA